MLKDDASCLGRSTQVFALHITCTIQCHFKRAPCSPPTYRVLEDRQARHWIRSNNDPPSTAVSKQTGSFCWLLLPARLCRYGSLLWRPLLHRPQTKHWTTHWAVLARRAVLCWLLYFHRVPRLSLRCCQVFVSPGTPPGQSGAMTPAPMPPTPHPCATADTTGQCGRTSRSRSRVSSVTTTRHSVAVEI